MMKRPEFLETKRTPRYSLRKLNVGVASVLLGVTIFGINFTDHSVKAATIESVENSNSLSNSNSQQTSAVVLKNETNTQQVTSTTEKVQQGSANNNTTANNSTEAATTSQYSPNTQGSADTDINPSAARLAAKNLLAMNLFAISDTNRNAAGTPDPTVPDNSANTAIINNQNNLANDWMQLEQGKLKIYFTVRGFDNKIYVSSYADAQKKIKSLIISNRLDPNSLEFHVDFENTDVKKNISIWFGWNTSVIQIDTRRLGTDGIVAYGKSGKQYQIGLNHDGGFYDYYKRMVELGKDISKVGALYMTDPIEANDTISTVIPVKYIGNKKQTTSISLTSYFKGYKAYPGLELEFLELHPTQIETPAKPTTDKDTVTTGIYNNPQITTSDWLKMVHGEAIAYYTAKGKDGKTYVTGYVAANGKSQSIINVEQIDLSTLEYHLIYHNGDKEVRSGLWANFADNKTIAIDTSRLGADGPQLKSQQGWSYKWAINGPSDRGIYYNSWAEYLKAHNNVGDQATNISMTGVAFKPDDMVELVIPVKYTGQLSARTPSLAFSPHINDYGNGSTQNWADLYFTTVHKDLSKVKQVVLLPTEFMGEQPGQSDWKLVKEIPKDMLNGWEALKISNFPTFKGSFNMDSLPKGDLPPVVYGSVKYFIDLRQIQQIFANHGYTVRYANNNGKAQKMPFYAYSNLSLAVVRVDNDGKPVDPSPVDPSIWVIHVQAVPAIILNKDEHYVADPNAKPWDRTSMIDEIYAADDAGQRKTRDQLEKLPKTDVHISYEYKAPGATKAVEVDKVDLTKAGVYTVTYSHTYADGQVVKDSRKVYVDDVKQETKDITRTIIVHTPNGTDQKVIQKATLTRKGILDATTGEIKSVGKWSTAKWETYSAPEFKGYTPAPAQIAETTVNEDTQDTTVEISYTANDQTATITYIDDTTGKTLATDTANGKFGQAIAFEVTPNQRISDYQDQHYVLVSNSFKGNTYQANNQQNRFEVHLTHATTPISDTKTVTRTIIEHLPNGKDQTTKQSVTLKMTGTKNLVTGEITDAKWTSGKFDEFTPEAVPGYTPSQAKVASEAVTSDTKDQTINVSYTAKDQSINVIYRDGNQVIKQVPLTGKTGETVDVNLDVPANYHVVNTPAKTYTFKADGNQDIIVELAHNTEKVTDNKTIMRTINVTSPDGQVTTTKQTVTLTRTGIKDLVTGTTTWDGWSTGSWDEFDVSAILGYTPSQAKVASEAVTSDTKDQTINVSYTPNSINPTNPMNPTTPTSPTMPTAPVNPTTPGANTNIPGAVVTPGQATTNDNHQKANQLPQTGNTDHNAESVVGVGLAALAGIFGLLGLKKKKREDQ